MARERIAALFLDVGGVLLTNGWDRAARRRGALRFGLDLEELEERHHLTYTTLELGKLSLEEYLDRVVFHAPRPFGRREFRRFLLAQSAPHPEMMALVRDLRARHGLKVAVVSNEGRELMEHRIRAFSLASFVDFFVVSCFVNCRKPDPDIFRLALDVAQVPPERVAYIEDRAMFVDVANSLGLHGIRHVGLESTLRALTRLGLGARAGRAATSRARTTKRSGAGPSQAKG